MRKVSKAPFGRDSLVALKCEKGHRWTTPISELLRGRWCEICRANLVQRQIFQALKRVREKQFVLDVGRKPTSMNSKIAIVCSRKHRSSITVKKALAGKSWEWCRRCQIPSGEAF